MTGGTAITNPLPTPEAPSGISTRLKLWRSSGHRVGLSHMDGAEHKGSQTWHVAGGCARNM